MSFHLTAVELIKIRHFENSPAMGGGGVLARIQKTRLRLMD